METMPTSSRFEDLVNEWLQQPHQDPERTVLDQFKEELHEVSGYDWPQELTCRFLETRMLLRELSFSQENISKVEQVVGDTVDDLLTRDWFERRSKLLRGEKIGIWQTTCMPQAIRSVTHRRLSALALVAPTTSLEAIELPNPEPRQELEVPAEIQQLVNLFSLTIDLFEIDNPLPSVEFSTLNRVIDLDGHHGLVDEEKWQNTRKDFYKMIATIQLNIIRQHPIGLQMPLRELPPFLQVVAVHNPSEPLHITSLPTPIKRGRGRPRKSEGNK